MQTKKEKPSILLARLFEKNGLDSVIKGFTKSTSHYLGKKKLKKSTTFGYILNEESSKKPDIEKIREEFRENFPRI